MKRIRCLFTLLWAVQASCPAAGQISLPDTTRQQLFIAAKFEPGFILTDSKTLAPLAKSKPWLAQLDFSLLKNAQRSWDNCTCYSKTGVSISYVDFNNPKLGKALSLIPFVEPYFFFSGKVKFSVRGGAGLSYLTKIYNANTNPDNLFFSSRVSFLLMLNLNLYYSVTPALRLGLSAQFNHISNGGLKWPNYGINFPTAGLGLEYVIHPGELRRRTSTPLSDHSLKIITHFFGTQRTTDPSPPLPEEKRILAGINSGVVKRISRITSLGLGGEVYYDGINKVFQQRSGQEYHTMIGALALQHYIFFGRLLFGQQLAYTVTKLNPDVTTRIYQRYFLEYRVKARWYGGVSLKAYGDHSEHFALTSGMVL